ncbi:MAG: FtsW/RodA/SpoVE family cell cycle protein [Anaerolineaceae bacterium]|nr:FtsW/RodA/SpoVE family cell cycle protein [Anaerolineaceae bacterium]
MSVASVNKSSIRKPKLILWAVLFVLFYTAVLSISSAIRLHLPDFSIKVIFFIPFLAWLFWVLLVQRALQRSLPNRDPLIFPLVALLSGWGLLSVWRLSPNLGFMQTLWFSVASLLAIFILKAKNFISTLKRYKYIWLVIGLLLLALTFFVGVNPSETGPRLWLRFLNVYLQPSEPLKLLLIIYLSAFFADQLKPNSTLVASILPTVLLTLIAGMLLIWQRDLGTAVLIAFLYMLMLTVTTQKRRFLWIFPLVILLAGIIGYFTLPIVRSRLDVWLHPWLDTKNASYQLIQSRIAIAAGSISGAGPGLGSPYLVPVAVSDFIYTVIAEEFGLLGSVPFLMLLLLLIIRGIVVGIRSKTSFGRYLAFGLSSYLALQTLIIVSGNLGLIPLTGVTLPFVSYGGSSLVTNMAAVAILLRISTENRPDTLADLTRKPYILIGSLFILLFAGLILRQVQLAVLERESLLARNENPRWAVWDQLSPRGTVLSQTGATLAGVYGSPGDFQLVNHVPALSHTLGYANGLYGQTGIQKSMYPYLRGLVRSDFDKIWRTNLLYNQPPAGLDIKININLSLQNKTDQLLGQQTGAVVLMNAKSGEIYTLSSHPGFDSNTLNERWESLMASSEAPLVNRTTQSKYMLGTLSHLFYLLQDEQMPVLEGIATDSSRFVDAECLLAMQGQAKTLDQQRYGCELDPKYKPAGAYLKETAELMKRFALDSVPDIALEVAPPSKFPEDLAKLAYDDLAAFRVSPLQMALVASTITNDGYFSDPRLVNSYLDDDGHWKTFENAISSHMVIPDDLAEQTQKRLSEPESNYWYQMGHSNEDGKIYTWLIGGNTKGWTGSPLALAILLESSNPDLAKNIARAILSPTP